MKHSPIPGPFSAKGRAVHALDHGRYYTVLSVNGVRLTDTAQTEFATYTAHVLNVHDDLLAALRAMVTCTYGTDAALKATIAARAAIAKAEGQS